MCAQSPLRPVATTPATSAVDLRVYSGRRVVWVSTPAANGAAVGVGAGGSVTPGHNGPVCMPCPPEVTGTGSDAITLTIDLSGE